MKFVIRYWEGGFYEAVPCQKDEYDILPVAKEDNTVLERALSLLTKDEYALVLEMREKGAAGKLSSMNLFFGSKKKGTEIIVEIN